MANLLRISPQAHRDIAAIYDYILKDGESIAKKQVADIYGALSNLVNFPNMGKSLNNYISQSTDYKFLIINKLYLAFYKICDDRVDVVRVLRGEQDYITVLGLNEE
ncbi:MAG: type II toxin-antitoxin system RelE/ParE family toxin [Clostridiales bacterium]|nr:type II toxin-antitoxin system RelE/ParE family toxin [Clostridiales bacterium]